MNRYVLVLTLFLMIALIGGAQSKPEDLYLVISGNTHSRIYLQEKGKGKICLPCNRAALVKSFGNKAFLLEYGYISPGSYGDVVDDTTFFDKRKKDYYACLKQMGYDWICDLESKCQDKVLDRNGVRIGLIKIDKERMTSPDKYNSALAEIRGADLLIWAVDGDVDPENFRSFLSQHSEVDIVLLPRQDFLKDSDRMEVVNNTLLLVPYPDGMKVDLVQLRKEDGTWEAIGVKEVSVLGLSPDPEVSSVVKSDCYANLDCKTGYCRNGKCMVKKEDHPLKLIVVRPERCVSCNEKEVYDWLKGFLPSLELKIVYSNSNEAKDIFTKINTDMLPVYIIQGNVEEVDGFENIEDMLVKSKIGYLIRPQLVGMSVFRNRKRIPKRVDVFISGRLSNSVYQELRKIKEVKDDPGMKGWRFYFHYLISREKGVWSSFLGPEDMSEVVRQLCVRKYAPNKYLNYILCRYELGYPEDDSCEIRLGIDLDKVDSCITNSGELAFLLFSSSKLTKEVGANTPGLILFENQQIFVPSADVISSESFRKWSSGKE